MTNKKSKLRRYHGIRKFMILIAIVLAYASFVSIKFGVAEGSLVTLLTWAFFVTCTPIADAGFLVDFPIRVVFGLKMIVSELVVWAIALGSVIYALTFSSSIFSATTLLQLFKTIISNPIPLWSIVVVSFIGTFLSIYIGDQIYELVQQKNHHKKISKLQLRRVGTETAGFSIVIVLYFSLLSLTGISVSLA